MKFKITSIRREQEFDDEGEETEVVSEINYKLVGENNTVIGNATFGRVSTNIYFAQSVTNVDRKTVERMLTALINAQTAHAE